MVPPPPAVDEKAVSAINEASKRELANWFTFLTLGTYLAVAVGATTHRQLFLEQPVKLPLFNVDLPLAAFFVVAPALFVVLHFYVLLQLQMLTDRVRAAIASLAGPGDVDERLAQFGRRLDTFFVSQLLVEKGDRLTRVALYAITWITLIAAPVALLAVFQLVFLPYHDLRVTWFHRALLLADLALVCFLEPRLPNVLHIVRRGWDPFLRPRRPSIAGCVASLAIAYLSIAVATIPDEAIERPVDAFLGAATLRGHVFSDGVDVVRGRPAGFFARRLVLADHDFVDQSDAALAAADRTVVLRGRDLRFAVLDRTDLRKADFTAADLRGASMIGARLDGARFACARDPTPGEADDFAAAGRPGCVRLDAARFDGATLRRARFDWAAADGASFASADLAGAGFWRSTLRLADFTDAKLPGARLPEAQVEGAVFIDACAIGADLAGARGFGAVFLRADLRGAALGDADLIFTAWDDADLRQTDLRKADLAGATLVGTDLRGAALGPPALDATILRGAELEGAWIEPADQTGVVDLGERLAPVPSRRVIAAPASGPPACERPAMRASGFDAVAAIGMAPGLLRGADALAPPDADAQWQRLAQPVSTELFIRRLVELLEGSNACPGTSRDAAARRLSWYGWGIRGESIRTRLQAACP
ncbi:MAG: pentapeptide repeat-containing protein [Alphaproteobacteria bacterium]|nr:pentapeptide repeat-containing protein [Alphaproteobacteria bacterium]